MRSSFKSQWLAVALLIPLALHAEAQPPGPGSGAFEAIVAPSKSKGRDLDDDYRAILKDLGRLRAIWKQQPENDKALRREVGRLQEKLAALRKAVAGPNGQDGTQKSATKQGKSDRPRGPQTPQRGGPTEAEVQKLIEALEKTHRPGTPLQATPEQQRSLAGVPAAWIVKICDAANLELRKMSRAVSRQAVDRASFQGGLDRLELVINRMDSPTAEIHTDPPNSSQ